MNSEQVAVILKSFDAPDEVRVMQKGKFELVHLDGMTIGRATYEPGWKWSEHVGPSVGATRCPVEHVGFVLSGTATVAFDDGHITELRACDCFTFRRCRTTAGSLAMNRMFRCTFSEPRSTRPKVTAEGTSPRPRVRLDEPKPLL
jgi:hypothetical protein